MSVAEISEQLNLTSIKDHGWHIQVSKSTFWFCPSACSKVLHVILFFGAFLIVFALFFFSGCFGKPTRCDGLMAW